MRYAAILPILLCACYTDTFMTQAVPLARAQGRDIAARWSISEPNSAGGLTVHLRAANLTNKTIKYFDAWVALYNGVGDPIKGTIRGRHVAAIRMTGPYPPEKDFWGNWDSLWYNYAGKCFKVKRIKLIFMDGTSKSIKPATGCHGTG